jgi:hypothetical protein
MIAPVQSDAVGVALVAAPVAAAVEVEVEVAVEVEVEVEVVAVADACLEACSGLPTICAQLRGGFRRMRVRPRLRLRRCVPRRCNCRCVRVPLDFNF